LGQSAAADATAARISVIEENDAFALPPTDRWYTQGAEVHYLSAPLGAAAPALLGAYVHPRAGSSSRLDLFLGQEIFTPVNLSRDPPDPTDRPYAGWLYAGAGLLQETDQHILDHLELQLGMIGPDSLARQTQDSFHSLSGQVAPRAWSYQLRNEPGVVLSYERKWRMGVPLGPSLAVDAIPELGATVGNVYTYAEASALLRVGRNLNADYGAARMRPALSGTPWFDATRLEGSLGWSVFIGGQGRALARNIFLDGNSWQSSASVDKLPLVGDLTAGLSVFWAQLCRVDLALVWRSREFVTQPTIDRYGGINLTFRLPAR
jgi:hypothetical protein